MTAPGHMVLVGLWSGAAWLHSKLCVMVGGTGPDRANLLAVLMNMANGTFAT